MFRFEIRHMFLVVLLLGIVFAVQKNIEAIAVIYAAFLAVVSVPYLLSLIGGLKQSIDHAWRTAYLGTTILGGFAVAMMRRDVREFHAGWMPLVAVTPAVVGWLVVWRVSRHYRWLHQHVSPEALQHLEQPHSRGMLTGRVMVLCIAMVVASIVGRTGYRIWQTHRQRLAIAYIAAESGCQVSKPPKPTPGGWLQGIREDNRVTIKYLVVSGSDSAARRIPNLLNVRSARVDHLSAESMRCLFRTGGIRSLTVDSCDLPIDVAARAVRLTELRTLVICQDPDREIESHQVNAFIQCRELKQLHIEGPLHRLALERLSEFSSVTRLTIITSDRLTAADFQQIADMPKLSFLFIQAPLEKNALRPLQNTSRLKFADFQTDKNLIPQTQRELQYLKSQRPELELFLATATRARVPVMLPTSTTTPRGTAP